MKKDFYGMPLEEFDVYTENLSDPCFDTSIPPEYQSIDNEVEQDG